MAKRVLQVLLEEDEHDDVLADAAQEERSASAMGRILILEGRAARGPA